MRTDGVFTTKLVKIPNWPVNKTLKLIPFGDIHHDSPSHSADAFKKFKDYARKQKDVMFLGLGDYTDSFSTSERAIIYDHRLHESTRKREETHCKGRIQKLADELQFMRGNLIGLLGGNHFAVFADGTTGDQLLAEKLGTRYLGSCCAIRLSFTRPSSNATASVDLFCHHGRGGGTTAGGKYNAVEKLANVCDADIFLMGDNHARGCFPAGERLHIVSSAAGGISVRSKARWLGRTGSFLRAYVEGESNYVVDAALPPANLGWIEFTLTLRRDKSDGMSVDIGAVQ